MKSKLPIKTQARREFWGKEAKEALRKVLVEFTGCDIQTRGWPCGTCTLELFDAMGVPPEKSNRAWRAILNIRGDKEA